jgi:RNA polymerase sigma factor (sigma-70 family)
MEEQPDEALNKPVNPLTTEDERGLTEAQQFPERLDAILVALVREAGWRVSELQRQRWAANLKGALACTCTDEELKAQARQCYEQLAAALDDLNAACNWHLDERTQQDYVANLLAYVSVGKVEEQRLKKQVDCYHQDHETVGTLRDQGHEQHHETLTQWLDAILRILQREGLVQWAERVDHPLWTRDDLVQIAALEIFKSLPTYRYQSRLSSWIHSVICRSVQSTIKRKKTLPMVSLEGHPEIEQATSEAEQPEQMALDNTLEELLSQILQRDFSTQAQAIFRLRGEGYSLRKIAERTATTPWFVRKTLEQLRARLTSGQYPEIARWLRTADDDGTT